MWLQISYDGDRYHYDDPTVQFANPDRWQAVQAAVNFILGGGDESVVFASGLFDEAELDLIDQGVAANGELPTLEGLFSVAEGL